MIYRHPQCHLRSPTAIKNAPSGIQNPPTMRKVFGVAVPTVGFVREKTRKAYSAAPPTLKEKATPNTRKMTPTTVKNISSLSLRPYPNDAYTAASRRQLHAERAEM